jgi:hypothetical protein
MLSAWHEARLILPAPENSPGRLAVAGIERRLLEAFGGFTRHGGTAAWRDRDGILAEGAALIYDVAVPLQVPVWDRSGGIPREGGRAWLGAMETLRGIARDAARALAQDCVYLRSPIGRVHLVAPTGRDINPDNPVNPTEKGTDR